MVVGLIHAGGGRYQQVEAGALGSFGNTPPCAIEFLKRFCRDGIEHMMRVGIINVAALQVVPLVCDAVFLEDAVQRQRVTVPALVAMLFEVRAIEQVLHGAGVRRRQGDRPMRR